MPITASMTALNSNQTQVYCDGNIYHNTGVIDSHGFEINGVKTAVAGSCPIGNTPYSYNFTGNFGTTYTVRAYGHVYGGSYFYSGYLSITPQPTLPTVTTTVISAIQATTATGGGNVTAQGTYTVTARGICWNTSTNPTIANSKTVNGSGTGSFTSSMTGLSVNTHYYVRAYATSAAGTAYGAVQQFDTPTPPTVTTETITGTTNTTIQVGGNVSSIGSSAITARGICWGATTNPTITGSHTTETGSTGNFVSTLTGLTYPSLYFCRAYATNTGGTSYGVTKTFIPLANEVILSGITSSGNLVIPTGKNFSLYAIVGGGGGGGDAKGSPPFASAGGGGGGGGGLLHGVKHLKPTGGTFSVVVGNGGARNQGGGVGSTGAQSSVFGLIAYGGGYGACSGDIFGHPYEVGGNGANGGGGGAYDTICGTAGGHAVYGNQGKDGADGVMDFAQAGGGGGYSSGGHVSGGGSGLTLNYSGQLIQYAKGGDGGTNGGNGAINTGRGGAGGYQYVQYGSVGTLMAGGAGGKGIVFSIAGYNPWLMDVPEFTGSTILTGSSVWNKFEIAVPDVHNVDYYRVVRSSTSGGTYTQVATGTTGGTHIIYDKTCVYGTTYWYKVVAVNQYLTEDSLPQSITTTITIPNSPVLSGVLDVSHIDLDWTDSNTYKQKYEIWRKDNSGSYSLLTTITGSTYADSTIVYGHTYRYKIRGMIDYFAPTYIYSPYSNEVTIFIDALLVAPTGCTSSSTTCTGTTLNWHNNNVSGQTGNYIKEWNGTGYTTIATLSSGSTTYSITGLIPNTSHIYVVVAYNGSRLANSADIHVTTQDPTPFNINPVVTNLSANVTWSINDTHYGTAIRPEIRVSGDTSWTTKPNLAKNATSYTYTGLSWSTNYEGRLVRIGTEYPSIIFGIPTVTFKAPTNLIVTSIGDKQICLEWDNNSINDNLEVWVREIGLGWVNYSTINNTDTTVCVTGLSMLTTYDFVIINKYNGFSLSSNQAQATTTVSYIPSFCQNKSYTVTNTTCGGNTGMISIPDDATIFYDFTLTDISGNTYTLTHNDWSGLTASWYFIHAVVKQKWYTHYGNEDCYISWIPLTDTNTTISLFDTKIKNAVCGGFGGGKGRIVYEFYDSNSGATSWNFSLYNDRRELVNTQSLSSIAIVQYLCKSDVFYGMLENNFGCTYLIDLTDVPADKLWTVEGIQKLYLTPWSAAVSYNYYDSSSDDWYVAGLDSQQFTSTKISEYLNLPDFWYQIKLDTASMQYAQGLNRGQNGLTYREEITISIPEADNAKWKQLKTMLTQRYIVVFQDNNDNWWTAFYRNGAEIKSYQLNNNQYVITFMHPSVDKMLTAIDPLYVKLHIL